jgi:hypothetical protein
MEKTWKPQVAGVLNIIGGIPMFFVFFWLLFLSGIYALQRKKWKWVIIGSAIAITFVLGVISLILVIKSRAEFV